MLAFERSSSVPHYVVQQDENKEFYLPALRWITPEASLPRTALEEMASITQDREEEAPPARMKTFDRAWNNGAKIKIGK